MFNYRVSKYNPVYRNEKGVYTKNEWISYSDIGKEYDGVVFDINKYLLTEEQYIDFFINLFTSEQAKELSIYNVEKNTVLEDEINYLNNVGLDLTASQKLLFNKICDGYEVKIFDLADLLVLLLRECIWCKVVDEKKEIFLSRGFDLYFHVETVKKLDYLNRKIYQNLYID